jgi:hypothetical protein
LGFDDGAALALVDELVLFDADAATPTRPHRVAAEARQDENASPRTVLPRGG